MLKSLLNEEHLHLKNNKAMASGVINKSCQSVVKFYKTLVTFLKNLHKQFDTIFNDALTFFELNCVILKVKGYKLRQHLI